MIEYTNKGMQNKIESIKAMEKRVIILYHSMQLEYLKDNKQEKKHIQVNYK